MVRRALSLAVPWSTSTKASHRSSQSAVRSQLNGNGSLDANAVFMADAHTEQHDAPRRLSRKPSPTQSRWRRPSFSTKRRDDAAAATSASPPVSASNSSHSNTTATNSTSSTATPASTSTSSPPALAPAPDSWTEIKKLLRDRDDDTATASDRDSECSRPMKLLEEQAARRQMRAASAFSLRPPSTLIPDSLPVQPIQDIPDTAQIRVKFNIYNPIGPRWYKNHHLILPQTRMPLSSAFSPSFPPTRTAIGSGAATAVDAGRMPVLSRTPSGSPLPTPSGSQTRLGDGLPPKRTRKLSNTAHDNVDMLDATDPWGTNWHHQSPYDVRGLNGPAPQEQLPLRINSSGTPTTARPNGKPANPSPLHQSTSAVHLADPPHATVRKRTLSKPAVGIRRFFSHSTDDVARDVRFASAPVTPVEGESNESANVHRKLSKRGRTAPPGGITMDAGSNMLSVRTSMDKKDKRASFMGRIGKKFSVLRKPLHDHHSFMDRRVEDNAERVRERRPSLSSSIRQGTIAVSEPRKLSKRIPPPERKDQMAHRTSASIDIEFPLTIGHLTIANPDQPNSETASPVRAPNGVTASPQSSIAPLPPPKHSPPLPPESATEDDEPRPKSVLRVTNSPDHSPEDTPQQQTGQLPTTTEHSQPTRPFQQPQNLLSAPPEPELPLSPLLPPPPLGQHNLPSIPSFFSPAAVSVSLSTADLGSPPPLPAKNFVDPATLTDSPTSTEMDMDNMPDIATEPDCDRRTATPTPAPPVPPLPASAAVSPSVPRQQSELRTSIVPFPVVETHAESPRLPRAQKGKEVETDDSPLSRASLYVNPPTPMAHPSTIPFVAPPPAVGTRGIPASKVAAMEAAEEREREREKEKERAKALEREKEERVREWEREKEREMEREREREWEKERAREQKEREAAREKPREREREKEREREREVEKEKEREKAARAARRESRREEKTRREERDAEKERAARHAERSSRYEERPRGDERTSYYDDRMRVDERTSRYEDRTKHEEKDRSLRQSKRESVEYYRDREQDRSSRREKKERTSTTETFRLVRSPSDNLRYMQGVPTAIPVGQEQWTLVEAPTKRDREKDRSLRRDKERDKEREREREREREKEKEKMSPEKSSRRRESKRDDKHNSVHGSSRSHHRHSSGKESLSNQRASVTVTRIPLDGSLRHQRSLSLDDQRLDGDLHASKKDKDRRSSRRRDSKHAGGGHSSDSRSSPTGENALTNGNVSSGAPTAPSMERHASLRRAVSDVPAGAEQMMSITAREAWEADRMWKGKSMYDPENGAANIRSGASNYDPRNSVYSGQSNVAPRGSAYMLQSPYYGSTQQGSFYAIPVSVAQHPSPPSAHVYPSQTTFSPGRYDYPNAYRSYPETLDMNSPPQLANPLPEPPRQATYSPEPFILDPARQDDPALTPEYWSVYAGITTH